LVAIENNEFNWRGNAKMENMTQTFQIITGAPGGLQFYCWITTGLVFWSGLLTMRLKVSGAALLIFAIDTMIVKTIESALIQNNVSHPDWLIDYMYPAIPVIIVGLYVIWARNKYKKNADEIEIREERKVITSPKIKGSLYYKYRKSS